MNERLTLQMWTDDLHWAWRLRDQQQQQERVDCECKPLTSQENKELLELYVADLGNNILEDKAAIPNTTNEGPTKGVT